VRDEGAGGVEVPSRVRSEPCLDDVDGRRHARGR
jgi:hypothetical protein